jgi:hypothetical protein
MHIRPEGGRCQYGRIRTRAEPFFRTLPAPVLEYRLRHEVDPACSAPIIVPERVDMMIDVGTVICARD